MEEYNSEHASQNETDISSGDTNCLIWSRMLGFRKGGREEAACLSEIFREELRYHMEEVR